MNAIQVYADYGAVFTALASQVLKNIPLIEQEATPDSLEKIMERAHFIELRALEENGRASYFIHDDIFFPMDIPEDLLPDKLFSPLDQFAAYVKQRVVDQQDYYTKKEGCAVMLHPVFYTVNLSHAYDEDDHAEWWTAIDQFCQDIPEISDAIKKEIFTKLLQRTYAERGLTAEERALFEKLFFMPDLH